MGPGCRPFQFTDCYRFINDTGPVYEVLFINDTAAQVGSSGSISAPVPCRLPTLLPTLFTLLLVTYNCTRCRALLKGKVTKSSIESLCLARHLSEGSQPNHIEQIEGQANKTRGYLTNFNDSKGSSHLIISQSPQGSKSSTLLRVHVSASCCEGILYAALISNKANDANSLGSVTECMLQLTAVHSVRSFSKLCSSVCNAVLCFSESRNFPCLSKMGK